MRFRRWWCWSWEVHRFDGGVHVGHAPCPPAPPSHTAFHYFTCERCGAVDLFPEHNFNLTTPEFQREFLATLKEQRRWLIPTK